MKHSSILLALVLACGALIIVPLRAQRYTVPSVLTDKQVDNALTLGRANKLKNITQSCRAGDERAGKFGAFGVIGMIAATVTKNTTYDVYAMAAPGWIAMQAWNATRFANPLTTADVPPDWRQPTLHLRIVPVLPPQDKDSAAIFPSPIMTAVIKEQDRDDKNVLLQPRTALTFESHIWKNTLGATVEYKETLGEYDISALPSLHGDSVEMALGTEAGNVSCTMFTDTFKKLVEEK